MTGFEFNVILGVGVLTLVTCLFLFIGLAITSNDVKLIKERLGIRGDEDQ